MNTEQLPWFLARSSGITSWALATSSVLFGLALSTRLVRKRGVPAWLLSLHRYIGTLTLVFTGVHLAALVADNYVHFGMSQLFVPMVSRWRPGAVAWGIVALYLLLAVQVTSWCKRWLPRRLWHAVHLTSLPMFVFGTVHGFQAGADAEHIAFQWGALTGVVSVLFLVIFRLTSDSRHHRGSARRSRGSGGNGDVLLGDERARRIAAVRARSAGNALHDERLDGGVEPTIGERNRQVRGGEHPPHLLTLADGVELLPGGLDDSGPRAEPIDVGL